VTSVVFLGPTLPVFEARAVLPDGVFLPPVGEGDLVSALAHHQPGVVGIVDGVFYQHPPVWHKEILWALERGIAVFGAASMGALRASECDAFGMTGIGEIYRRYAEDELTDDDEVAVAHDDELHAWRVHSEPLVNVRATMEAAVAEGRLTQPGADTLVAASKGLWFPQRTRERMLAAARAAGLPPDEVAAAAKALAEHYVDLKRLDALALLAAVREAEAAPPSQPAFQMARSTSFFISRERDRTVQRACVPLRLEEIARHVALNHARFPELRDRALDRLLAAELAHVLGVQPSPEEIDAEERRQRDRLGLADAAGLTAWLEANDLEGDQFAELVAREAAIRRLRDWMRIRRSRRLLVQPLLDELRLAGEYERWADLAAHERREADEADDEPLRAPSELIRDHAAESGWRCDVPVSRWADEAGFDGQGDLADALAQAYLARQPRRRALELLIELYGSDE